MMRSVLVCSLLVALSSTVTGFSPCAPLALRRGRGVATGATTRLQPPAVATRRAHAAELRCTATKLDLETSCELEASDLQEFTSTLTHSKVVFVKMYQGRCRQCIALAPKFKSLAQEHSRSGEVVFMKVSPATLPTPLHEHLSALAFREFNRAKWYTCSQLSFYPGRRGPASGDCQARGHHEGAHHPGVCRRRSLPANCAPPPPHAHSAF